MWKTHGFPRNMIHKWRVVSLQEVKSFQNTLTDLPRWRPTCNSPPPLRKLQCLCRFWSMLWAATWNDIAQIWNCFISIFINNHWLVVSNIFFHNIWDNPCHWLIFFKMVETTNQFCCAACSQYKLIIPVILRWHSSGITIKNPSCMDCMDCIVQLGSSHVACRWINHDQSRRGISLVIIIILAGAVPFLHG